MVTTFANCDHCHTPVRVPQLTSGRSASHYCPHCQQRFTVVFIAPEPSRAQRSLLSSGRFWVYLVLLLMGVAAVFNSGPAKTQHVDAQNQIVWNSPAPTKPDASSIWGSVAPARGFNSDRPVPSSYLPSGPSDVQLPPHVYLNVKNVLVPEPGYDWVNARHSEYEGVAISTLLRDHADEFKVTWRPGTPNPDSKNVVASSQIDRWTPAPGYRWVTSDPDHMTVKWMPGIKSIDDVNLVSAAQEGQWEKLEAAPAPQLAAVPPAPAPAIPTYSRPVYQPSPAPVYHPVYPPTTYSPPAAENGSYYGQLNQNGIPKTVAVSGYFRKERYAGVV